MIVDGHSVIFAWPELHKLHRNDPGKARDVLVRRLEELSDASFWKVTVVFDGRSSSRSSFVPREGVEVWYTRGQESADSLIEAMVAQAPAPTELVVVTADQGERCLVEGLGAFCVSPDWLRMEWESSRQALEQRLQQVHRRARW